MIPINKYPYTDLHEMNMDWVLEQIKQLTEAWAQTQTDWSTMQGDFATLSGQFTNLKNYVDNFFDNLDLQEEVNTKLDEMALNGTLTNLIASYVDSYSVDTVSNSDTHPITSRGVFNALGPMRYISETVNPGETKEILFDSANGQRSYQLITTASNGANLLNYIFGCGFGAGSSNHVMFKAIDASGCPVTQSTNGFGVVVENYSSLHPVQVHITTF